MKLRTAKRSSSSLQLVAEKSDDKPTVLAFRKSFSRIVYLLVLITGALLGLHHVVGLMFVSTAVVSKRRESPEMRACATANSARHRLIFRHVDSVIALRNRHSVV